MSDKFVGYLALLRKDKAVDDTICARKIYDFLKRGAATKTLPHPVLEPFYSKSAQTGTTQIPCLRWKEPALLAHGGNGVPGVMADRLSGHTDSRPYASQPLIAGLGQPDTGMSNRKPSEHALENSILEFMQTMKELAHPPPRYDGLRAQEDKNDNTQVERPSGGTPDYSDRIKPEGFPDLTSETHTKALQHVLAIESQAASVVKALLHANDIGPSTSKGPGPAEVAVALLKAAEEEPQNHLLARLQEELATTGEPATNWAEMISLLIFNAAMIPGWRFPALAFPNYIYERDEANRFENLAKQQADYMTYLANFGVNTALMRSLSARTRSLTWESTLLHFLLAIACIVEEVFEVLQKETAALQTYASEQSYYRDRLMPFKAVSRSRIFLG